MENETQETDECEVEVLVEGQLEIEEVSSCCTAGTQSSRN